MTFRFADLWRWDGKVGRAEYAAVGLIGVAIKHNLDRLIALAFFANNLNFLNYWAPLGKAARLDHLSNREAKFLATLLLFSVPFLWVGVAMTVKRLRDAGQPVWLVVLFFFPVINVLFFLALCALPPRERAEESEGAPWPGPTGLSGMIPSSPLGSAVLSIFLTSVLGLVFLTLGTLVIGAYGWGLFVALPFCLGMFSVLLYSYHSPRDWWTCLNVALLPVGILGVTLILVAMEGVICVLMAAPFALGLAALGGMLGYTIQAHHWRPKQTPAMLSIVILLIPASFGIEHAAALQPPTSGADGNRGERAAGESLESGRGVRRDTAAERIAVSRGDCVSNSRGDFRAWSRRGAALRFFDRAICRADRSVGRAAAAEVWRDGESGSTG